MGEATGGGSFGDGLLRVLLDHCVPAKLRLAIAGHEVVRAVEVGLEDVSNGKLLNGAEALGFDVVVTIDKKMRFQQSMWERAVATVVLDRANSKLESLLPLVPRLLEALPALTPGEVRIISEP